MAERSIYSIVKRRFSCVRSWSWLPLEMVSGSSLKIIQGGVGRIPSGMLRMKALFGDRSVDYFFKLLSTSYGLLLQQRVPKEHFLLRFSEVHVHPFPPPVIVLKVSERFPSEVDADEGRKKYDFAAVGAPSKQRPCEMTADISNGRSAGLIYSFE